MSDLKNYQIRIGKTIYLDDQTEEKKLDSILKEMRIRIGILLKTDEQKRRCQARFY